MISAEQVHARLAAYPTLPVARCQPGALFLEELRVNEIPQLFGVWSRHSLACTGPNEGLSVSVNPSETNALAPRVLRATGQCSIWHWAIYICSLIRYAPVSNSILKALGINFGWLRKIEEGSGVSLEEMR